MAEFKKSWRSAYDKKVYVDAAITNFPHNVNDPNSSHYLKAETYTRDEVGALFEPIISGIGTIDDYYRGDRTWANLADAISSNTLVENPITLVSGIIGLTWNTTNLRLSVGQLNTIQNISTTSTPTFNRLILNNQATSTNYAVRADRTLRLYTGSDGLSISDAGASPVDLTSDRAWSINLNTMNIKGTTNQIYIDGTTTSSSRLLKTAGDILDDVTFTLPQDIHTGASPTFANLKLTSLTDGYLPYHVSDVNGFSNSPFITNGTSIILGGTQFTPFTEKFFLIGNFLQSGNYSIYNNFTSGWAGTGWRVDYGISETAMGSLELDKLWVRGTMTVYELVINRIRATNGSLFVSSAARVDYTVADTEALPHGWIYFEDPDNELVCPFLEDDIIMGQHVSLDGTTLVDRKVFNVISVSGLSVYADSLEGGWPTTGEIDGWALVRIGNLSNTSRQGSLYLTSDDSNSPYMDVIDGVSSYPSGWGNPDKLKVRIGRLTGVTDTFFGTLTGYGMYAKNNIYIRGKIYAEAGGWLAGWDINATELTSPSVVNILGETVTIALRADDTSDVIGSYMTIVNLEIGTPQYVSFGRIQGTSGAYQDNYGIAYKTYTGSNYFELSNTTKEIAGWSFDTSKFYSGDAASANAIGLSLSKTSVNYGSNFWDSSRLFTTGFNFVQRHTNLSNESAINIGELMSTVAGVPMGSQYNGWYGIQGFDIKSSVVYEYFTLAWNPTTSATRNIIAGWKFDDSKIYRGNTSLGFSLNTSSTPFLTGGSQKGFEIYDISSPKLFLGNKAGNYLDYNITAANTLTVQGTFQTASSGQRIVLNETGYLNTVRWYTSTGNTITMTPADQGSIAGIEMGQNYFYFVWNDTSNTYSSKIDYATGSWYKSISGGYEETLIGPTSISVTNTTAGTGVTIGTNGDIYSNSIIVGRYRGAAVSLPTTNLRDGDIFVSTGLPQRVYIRYSGTWGYWSFT